MASDPISDFFEKIKGRPEMLPKRVAGVLRIDLEVDGGMEHWFLEMDAGNLRVSRREREADCVLRATKAIFERMVLGEENLQAAAYRTEVIVEGSFQLIAQLRKLLPGPTGSHDPREFAKSTNLRREQ